MEERLVAACPQTVGELDAVGRVEAIANAVVEAARMLLREQDEQGGFTPRAVHELEAALHELHVWEER
jgi:hypothetical protein